MGLRVRLSLRPPITTNPLGILLRLLKAEKKENKLQAEECQRLLFNIKFQRFYHYYSLTSPSLLHPQDPKPLLHFHSHLPSSRWNECDPAGLTFLGPNHSSEIHQDLTEQCSPLKPVFITWRKFTSTQLLLQFLQMLASVFCRDESQWHVIHHSHQEAFPLQSWRAK